MQLIEVSFENTNGAVLFKLDLPVVPPVGSTFRSCAEVYRDCQSVLISSLPDFTYSQKEQKLYADVVCVELPRS